MKQQGRYRDHTPPNRNVESTCPVLDEEGSFTSPPYRAEGTVSNS